MRAPRVSIPVFKRGDIIACQGEWNTSFVNARTKEAMSFIVIEKVTAQSPVYLPKDFIFPEWRNQVARGFDKYVNMNMSNYFRGRRKSTLRLNKTDSKYIVLSSARYTDEDIHPSGLLVKQTVTNDDWEYNTGDYSYKCTDLQCIGSIYEADVEELLTWDHSLIRVIGKEKHTQQPLP